MDAITIVVSATALTVIVGAVLRVAQLRHKDRMIAAEYARIRAQKPTARDGQGTGTVESPESRSLHNGTDRPKES